MLLAVKRCLERGANKSLASKPTHETHGSVLDDLGFPSGLASVLKFKAELYQAILKVAKRHSQKKLQRILGEPQPRVRELLNGKIANKSVEKLLYYAGRLGIEARAKLAQTHEDIVEKGLAIANQHLTERDVFVPSNAASIPRHSGRQPVATRGMMDRIGPNFPTTLLPNIFHSEQGAHGGGVTVLVEEAILTNPPPLLPLRNDCYPTRLDAARSSSSLDHHEACLNCVS